MRDAAGFKPPTGQTQPQYQMEYVLLISSAKGTEHRAYVQFKDRAELGIILGETLGRKIGDQCFHTATVNPPDPKPDDSIYTYDKWMRYIEEVGAEQKEKITGQGASVKVFYRIESWRFDVALRTLETPMFEGPSLEVCDQKAIGRMETLSAMESHSWDGLRVSRIDTPATEERTTFLADNGRQN